MNQYIELAIVVVVLAVDGLRNSLFSFLYNADAILLVVLLALVYYLSKQKLSLDFNLFGGEPEAAKSSESSEKPSEETK